ncbi:MAG TPA: dodecin domain-containing protein [Candidatus Sumerlaeota bacterium]|nr:MAG: hypothetical protein BWY12_00531 [candidate division BRC1 bacterium ADurb.Bin183]HON51544.1 dodecin domain-containing protein [Candidatus Sumerlaeota bacterium]HRR31148.1 dodecin domain-containing protein [Candidatus Sumerlaeia bacterium]HPL74706.1 dodecin domain-containing protein [Candidatus Sumerlaeota bacterium]HQH10858.1 dodecin domain-containing protein [Candidatus Sumerlaeota bacterium]
MLKMIEVIGISPIGFSDAVKKAVDETVKAGKKIHFFETVEQRGTVSEGKIKEFQVKIRIAVDMKTETDAPLHAKEGSHVCPTCGQHSGPDGHMCYPVSKEDKTCDWCGNVIPDERHLCDGKLKELTYICNSCGRTAVKAEYLCNPAIIK